MTGRLIIALVALLILAPAARAADPVVAVVGDAVCDPTLKTSVVTAQTCQHKAVSDLILRQHPARVLLPGDLQYESGTSATFASAYNPSYGRFKSISCAVPGNHEYRTPSASGYKTYWGQQTVSGAFDVDCPVPGAPNWTISGLDTSLYCFPVSCSNQSPWLKGQLAKAPTCEIAFFHIPMWSSSIYKATSGGAYPFYRDMFYGHGELILTGHLHHYERFGPQDPWHNANAVGQRQIVVGTGGKNLETFRTTPEKNSVARVRAFGALFITLHPASYDLRFIATDNRVLDQALGIPCRA